MNRIEGALPGDPIDELLMNYRAKSAGAFSAEQIEGYVNSVNLLEDVFYASKTAVLIIEYATMRYLYCANTDAVLGHAPEKFVARGPAFVLGLARQRQLEIYSSFVPSTLEFFQRIDPAERSRYRFSFTIDLRNGDGQWVSLLQQNFFLRWSSTGEPLAKMILLTDITDHRADDDAVYYYVSRMNDNGTRTLTDFRKYAASGAGGLTNRETEVLNLFGRGKSTRAIARQLNISHHTVVAHKKSVLKKVGAKSLSHAVSLGRLYGLITNAT